jgi:hypothetical protein
LLPATFIIFGFPFFCTISVTGEGCSRNVSCLYY